MQTSSSIDYSLLPIIAQITVIHGHTLVSVYQSNRVNKANTIFGLKISKNLKLYLFLEFYKI